MVKETYIEKMSEKELGMFLPLQMKETDVLSTEAKKVLAVLIEGFVVTKKAKECGFLVASNARIKTRAGISGSGLMKAIRELELYNLIERHQGSKWKKGEERKASEYIVNWDNIRKELKEKTCEDLIEEMGLSLLSTSTIDYPLSTSTSSSSINSLLSTSSLTLTSSSTNTNKNKVEENNPEEKEKTFVEEFEEKEESFIDEFEQKEGVSLNRYLYNLFKKEGIESVENWYNTNVVYFKSSSDFKKYNSIASALNAVAYPIASTLNEAGAKASKKFDKEMAASMRGVEGGFALCKVNELV